MAASESWSEVLRSGKSLSESDAATIAELGLPSALDEANAILLDNVHPRGHTGPESLPDEPYDLVAIGAGAAGLVSAKQCARRGGRSALIEMHLHGGDCLNVGCVPSKALIRAARAVREAKHAGRFGISTGEVRVDFPFIMKRMRELRARIAPADAVSLTSKCGADVFTGRGVFTGPDTIEVSGRTLRFKKAVVATGGSARVFPTPGLQGEGAVPYMTNASLFNLEALPPRLAIVGAGPIGLEMAQSFSLFGSKVTVLDIAPEVMFREDPDVRGIVRESLEADGVAFEMGIKGLGFSHVAAEEGAPFPVITASYIKGEAACSIECDALLIATGRKPNVEGIGLDKAGIEYHGGRGITVDDLMVTSNPNVYAIGDCASMWQFTHMAGTQAQMVVDAAVFGVERKVSDLVIPRCTYTTPEVAATGESEATLKTAGIEFDVYQSNLQHVDRAILESSDTGFCKILCRKDTGEMLGATVVAENAGDIISELTVCIQTGVKLGDVSRCIHPYPTVAECIAGCAFGYKVKHIWPTMSKQ